VAFSSRALSVALDHVLLLDELPVLLADVLLLEA
jgi:hypothetical protein